MDKRIKLLSISILISLVLASCGPASQADNSGVGGVSTQEADQFSTPSGTTVAYEIETEVESKEDQNNIIEEPSTEEEVPVEEPFSEEEAPVEEPSMATEPSKDVKSSKAEEPKKEEPKKEEVKKEEPKKEEVKKEEVKKEEPKKEEPKKATSQKTSKPKYTNNLDNFRPQVPLTYPDVSSCSQTVLEYANMYREEVGAPALKRSADLDAVALERCNDMIQNDYISHYKDGVTMAFYLGDMYGIRVNAENLAWFSRSDNDDMGISLSEGWRNSPHHYETMISTDYKEIGIAIVEGPTGGWYGIQLFR